MSANAEGRPIPFRYTAVRPDGTTMAGTVLAESRETATALLRDRALLPVTVRRRIGPKLPTWPLGSRGLGPRATRRLLRALTSLAAARAPIADAFALVVSEWRVTSERSALEDMQRTLRSGGSLADTLRPVLEPNVAEIIRAGEMGGDIAKALERAASLLERQAERSARAIEAVIYPLILLVAASATMAVLFGVVVPNIAPLVADRFDKLPLFTRMVIAASEQAEAAASLLLIGAALILAGAFATARTARGREALDGAALRVPGISNYVRLGAEASVLTTFAALVQGGVTAVAALELAARSARNSRIQAECLFAAASVRHGEALSGSLQAAHFSSDAVLLARIGERSGTLGDSLGRAADIAEQRLDQSVQRALSLLGPAMIVAIGLATGLVVAAVFSAVMAVNELGS